MRDLETLGGDPRVSVCGMLLSKEMEVLYEFSLIIFRLRASFLALFCCLGIDSLGFDLAPQFPGFGLNRLVVNYLMVSICFLFQYLLCD